MKGVKGLNTESVERDSEGEVLSKVEVTIEKIRSNSPYVVISKGAG